MTTNVVSEKVSPTTRRFNLHTLSLVFIVIGLAVTTYLSYLKAFDTTSVCVESGAFNCEIVLNSAYSRLAGIPIAYLGLMVYIVLGVLLVLENRVAFLQNYGVMLIFGITLFAWMFSMYLVYLQFFVLQSLCMWCLTHETNITLFFIVTIVRLRNALRA
jgi:uncharacterized membrane protein